VVLLVLSLVLLLIVGVGVLVLVLVVPVLFAEEGGDGCDSEDEEGAAAVLWDSVLVTRKDREKGEGGRVFTTIVTMGDEDVGRCFGCRDRGSRLMLEQ
jgi:hypothetical protein